MSVTGASINNEKLEVILHPQLRSFQFDILTYEFVKVNLIKEMAALYKTRTQLKEGKCIGRAGIDSVKRLGGGREAKVTRKLRVKEREREIKRMRK